MVLRRRFDCLRSVFLGILQKLMVEITLDKINFYYMARCSITELQSHLEYSRRVGYLDGQKSNEIDYRLAKLHSDFNKVIVTLRNNISLKRKVGNNHEMAP